jgi:hypothetical protein
MISDPVFNVRDLLKYTTEQLLDFPKEYTIVFEDGFHATVFRRETAYSRLFWRILEVYPETKILYAHHIHKVLNGKQLDMSSHLKLCSSILESICETYQLHGPGDKEPLLKLIYKTISDASNEFSILTASSMVGLDIVDFIEIAKHDLISKYKEEARTDPNHILGFYDNIIKALNEGLGLHNNNLIKAIRAKMAKSNQIVQCVAFRGKASEVNGDILPMPILHNYTEGLKSCYEYVADSRTAAKSYYYADAPLKGSETSARRFRLVTTVAERVAYHDCGSQEYVEWYVRPEGFDETGKWNSDGLGNIIGKYYLTADGRLRVIKGTEKELIGKYIKIRSPITCKTKNPHEICRVCIGKITENISQYANIGHLGSVTTTGPITQSVLSIKHVNTSSTGASITLNETVKQYFTVGRDKSAIYLSSKLAKMDLRLTILKEEFHGLIDIKNMEVLDTISLPRISQIKQCKVQVNVNGVVRSDVFEIKQGIRAVLASKELIDYIKLHGFEIDDEGNFVFNMTQWDIKKPLFVSLNKEYSFSDLAEQVSTLFLGNQKMLKERTCKDAAKHLLQEIYDAINSRISIGIVPLEIMIYGFMMKNDLDISLGRNSPDAVLGLGEFLTKNRSLSAALTYEDQHLTLTQPQNFIKGKRPDHPLDVFIRPQEVLEERASQGLLPITDITKLFKAQL